MQCVVIIVAGSMDQEVVAGADSQPGVQPPLRRSSRLIAKKLNEEKEGSEVSSKYFKTTKRNITSKKEKRY